MTTKLTGNLGEYTAARVGLKRAGSSLATDEVLAAWRALATDGVEMHKVPGDHYTLLARPAVARVAAILEEHLGRG